MVNSKRDDDTITVWFEGGITKNAYRIDITRLDSHTATIRCTCIATAGFEEAADVHFDDEQDLITKVMWYMPHTTASEAARFREELRICLSD